ncbi:hypothetical protein [Azoarcus sp. KH32C]|uniref:hypothetical protein n=1 Tax=Azoarcus sp. KH32C TaxID=748247 RepID=UPI0002386EFE|nr:hypothetical protein [Azoarcus sp. KH32C]BAL25518.1 hypothetical protein AZKH_3229 [Azoarcus sp. KH32C]
MNTPKLLRPLVNKQRGAVMVVALVLLVAVTLTALFTNRNLIFGVKSQGNQIKSIMAQEAAMGGLDTALAVLTTKENRDLLLVGSPAVGAWYNGRLYGFFLDTNGDGKADSLSLVSTTSATAPAVPTTGVVTSFQVRFRRLATPASITEENRVVRIDVLGCADGQPPNASNSACTARSIVTQSTIYKPGLASAPAAALTAKGDVTLSGNVQISNTDTATNGTTVHSGGDVSGLGSSQLVTIPGTPEGASVAPNDTTLNNLSDDQFFQGFFGASKESVQADATQISCSGSACGGAIKTQESSPRVLWVNSSDAQITASGTGGQIGSASAPVILIVNGPLQITGNVTIYGLVYCTAITWDNTGGGTSAIIGAAIAEGDFTATGTPNPTYDPAVLSNLGLRLGTYVRVAGGWKDWCKDANDCSFTSW